MRVCKLVSVERFILKKEYRFNYQLQVLLLSAVRIADDCSQFKCGALSQVTSMYEHTLNCTFSCSWSMTSIQTACL
jgi:hypothetical protein